MKNKDYLDEEIKNILSNENINFNRLKNKTLLVLSGTGSISHIFVKSLIRINERLNLNLNLVITYRKKEKLSLYEKEELEKIDSVFVDDYKNLSKLINKKIDYILHTMATTNSKEIVNNALEILDESQNIIRAVLDFSVKNKIEKLIYLSSMEVYGENETDALLNEENVKINLSSIRSVYPLSKSLCEMYCNIYSKKYGLNVAVIRLATVISPFFVNDDERLTKKIVESIKKEENFYLKTKGASKKNYIYISEVIDGILLLLSNKDEKYNVYNLANKNTYCSIKKYCEKFFKKCGKKELFSVAEDEDVLLYPKESKINLDVKKIENLGFKPHLSLDEMIEKVIKYN